MEAARVHRLTRNQHLLFRLGELAAYVECAGALARRASRAAAGALSPKADTRLDQKALAAASRVFAREAAMKVGQEGVAHLLGAAEPGTFDSAGLQADVGLAQILPAMTGNTADMDTVAIAVYEAAAT